MSVNSEVLIFNSQLLKERDYWKDRLSGITVASSLPADYDGVQDHFPKKSVIKIKFPQSLIQDIEELTGNSPFLIYTTFFAAAKICLHKYSLHKYSERQTLVVGSPALKELGRANSLAIVTEIDADMTFRQLLVNLRETLLEAYENFELSIIFIFEFIKPLGKFDVRGEHLSKPDKSAGDFDVDVNSTLAI